MWRRHGRSGSGREGRIRGESGRGGFGNVKRDIKKRVFSDRGEPARGTGDITAEGALEDGVDEAVALVVMRSIVTRRVGQC